MDVITFSLHKVATRDQNFPSLC